MDKLPRFEPAGSGKICSFEDPRRPYFDTWQLLFTTSKFQILLGFLTSIVAGSKDLLFLAFLVEAAATTSQI